jgi:hypothetical protein
MKRRQTIMAASLTVSLSGLVALSCGSEMNGGGGGDICADITGYVAKSTAPVSFATDIYPILADTNVTNGCGQTTICHGQPPGGLDDIFLPTKYLPFIFGTAAAPVLDAAMAKAQLLMPSVNAPTMQRVVPSNVGQSFLAYKIWDGDRKGLACVASMCESGASVGFNTPCGDEMPSVGTLDMAKRDLILDWIAKGAAD